MHLREKSSDTNVGMSFTGVLTLIFIVLKLLKIINWSWLWVLAPTWITLIVITIVLVVMHIKYKN